MAAIAVLGAGGPSGQRLVAAFGEEGHEVAAPAGDTADRGDVLQAVDLVVVALRDPAARAACLDAAVRAGTHALDAGADPHVAAHAYDGLEGPARDAGVVVVPAAGAAVGDLLAAIATSAVQRPVDAHVCWAFPDRGGWRRSLAPGYRAGAAGMLATPMPVLLDGRRAHERVGESRRLAWFPRPIGPAHAAGVPGPDPLAVPRHAPGVELVRTYLAVPTWRAELLQATANAVRSPRWQAVVARRWEQGTATGTGEDAPRWACVAESRGTDGVARAWAYGRDAIGLGVDSTVALAEAVLAARSDAGVVPPACVDLPATLLDALAVRTRLRWSVARPVAPHATPEAADGR